MDSPDLDKMCEEFWMEGDYSKQSCSAFAAKVDARARLDEAVNIAPNCAAGRHQECDICRHIAQLKKLT